MVYDVAAEVGLPKDHVIDVFGAMGGQVVKRRDLYIDDGVHPNDKGDEVIAKTVFEAITKGEKWL